jgi:hypothetical protein
MTAHEADRHSHKLLKEDTPMDTPNPSQGCPHHAAQRNSRGAAEAVADAGAAVPALRRMSEVERDTEPGAPMRVIAQWVRDYLARPHPELGRKGSVCPFVPLAITIDTIWFAEVTDECPSFESIAAMITACRDVFLAMEPASGPEALQKSFLVVFPTLGPDGAALVDKVQYALKKYFVDMGLMLGEFHAKNDSPGLRNEGFRPLRSPVPMLAIRHMVESDLPFLMRESYPAAERSSFLRSYLCRMFGQLTPAKFEQVLDRLLAAENELWQAGAPASARSPAQGAQAVARAMQPAPMGVAP